MRNVFAYELSSAIADRCIVERIRERLPEFKWRGGDSDMLGPYQSGTSDNGVCLRIWLGERPFDVLLSFSMLQGDMVDREAVKTSILQRVTVQLSELGTLVDVTANDSTAQPRADVRG